MSIKSHLGTGALIAGFCYRESIVNAISTGCNMAYDGACSLYGYAVSIPGAASSYVHQGQIAGVNNLDSMVPGSKEFLLHRVTSFLGYEVAGQKTAEGAAAAAGKAGVALGTLSIAAIPTVLPMVKYAGTYFCRWWQAGNQHNEVRSMLGNSSKKAAAAAIDDLRNCKGRLQEDIDRAGNGYKDLSERGVTLFNNPWNLGFSALACAALMPQVGVVLAVGVTAAGAISSVLCQWGNNSDNGAMVSMTEESIAVIDREITSRQRELDLDRLVRNYDHLYATQCHLVQRHNQNYPNDQIATDV